MAVFNSDAIATGAPVPGFGAGGGQVRTQYTRVAIPAGATTTDTIVFFRLPQNARVLHIRGKNDALGGGTLNVGDNGFTAQDGTVVAANTARFVAAQALTTAGGWNTIALTGLFLRNGRIPLTITGGFAAGPTTTAGNIELAIEYTVEEPQV